MLDQEFEKQLLAACLSDMPYLQRAARILSDYKFENHYMDWIWRRIIDQYQRNHELLPQSKLTGNIQAEFSDHKRAAPYLDLTAELFLITPILKNTALDTLTSYFKQQMMKAAIIEATEHLEKDHTDDAWRRLREMSATPSLSQVDYGDWFSTFDERQSRRRAQAEGKIQSVVVPTSIRFVDKYIGGLRGGELGTLLGVTSIGKTSMLVQFAYGAAMRGFHVLYMCLEMTRGQIETKLDAKLTQINSRQFKDWQLEAHDIRAIEVAKTRIQRMPRRELKDIIHVAAVPIQRCDINTVRGLMDDREANGIRTDMVIIDSGDHLKPVKRYDSYRVEHTMAYWDMKGLAEERECAIWSSCHAPKDYKNKLIWHAEATGESYDKARISDVVLAVSSNRAMALIDPHPEVAIVLAKNRDGELPKEWLRMQAKYEVCTFVELETEAKKSQDKEGEK